MSPAVLETDRLYFRPFTLEDAPLIYELDSDPEVMRYISKGKSTSFDRIQTELLPRWLKLYDRSPFLGFWATHEKASDNFIGWFHLKPYAENPEEIELGYRLRRAAWGKGYATEGGKALIGKMFELGTDRIVATTLEYNHASRRVMEKCGLQFEKSIVYAESLLPGWAEAERRGVKYGISRDSWLLLQNNRF